MKLKDVKVDEEIRVAIPAPENGTAELLKKDIARRGVREPLVVWKEEGVLLDGHHRLAACRELGIEEVPTVEYSFPDKAAAINWVVLNQLSRRNLDKERRGELISFLYERLKGKAGRKKKVVKKNGAHYEPHLRTAEKVSQEAAKAGIKVSPATVKRVVKQVAMKKSKAAPATKKPQPKTVTIQATISRQCRKALEKVRRADAGGTKEPLGETINRIVLG